MNMQFQSLGAEPLKVLAPIVLSLKAGPVSREAVEDRREQVWGIRMKKI